MLTKTKIAFAAALILGTASAALANDSGENSWGGFVHPPSTVGVNPAYHPNWFPGYARADRSSADEAYAFAPTATHKHRSPR